MSIQGMWGGKETLTENIKGVNGSWSQTPMDGGLKKQTPMNESQKLHKEVILGDKTDIWWNSVI